MTVTTISICFKLFEHFITIVVVLPIVVRNVNLFSSVFIIFLISMRNKALPLVRKLSYPVTMAVEFW